MTSTFFQAVIKNSTVPIFAAFPSRGSNLTVLDFEHGLGAAEKDYEYLSTLASSGQYVVISSGAHDSTLAETTTELSHAMLDTLSWVFAQANSNASFPLYQRLSGRSVAGGHSMGGGATFISVSAQPRTFMATLTYAPCGYPNEVYPVLGRVHVPSMVLVASKDCLCNGIPLTEFDRLNSTCKWLADITDASHCGFCKFNVDHDKVVCEAAERVQCPFTRHLDSSVQQNITLTISLVWLQYIASPSSETRSDLVDTLNIYQKKGQITWKTNC